MATEKIIGVIQLDVPLIQRRNRLLSVGGCLDVRRRYAEFLRRTGRVACRKTFHDYDCIRTDWRHVKLRLQSTYG